MKKYIYVFLPLLLLMVLFQNCSGEVQFSDTSGSDGNGGLEVPGDGDESGGGDGGDGGNTPDGGIPPGTTPPDGITVIPPPDGRVGLPPPPVFSDCDSFDAINGDVVSLPPGNTSKICYYIKLMDPIANHSSGSAGEVTAKDVIARGHGRTDPNPYILAEKVLTMSSSSSWKVALSGQYNEADANMKIDNFFLIEVQVEDQVYALARGTADAEPYNSHIKVSGAEVPNFISYAPGGTANVTAINLFTQTPVNKDFHIRFRALDCGGAAEASYVYLVLYQ